MSDERNIDTSGMTETNAKRCAYVYYSSGKACGALQDASEHRPNGFSTQPWHYFEPPAAPVVSSADAPHVECPKCGHDAFRATDGKCVVSSCECRHMTAAQSEARIAPSAERAVAESPFRYVASIQCDACGFWRESKSNDRRAAELVFSEWSDEHEGCEPAPRFSFADSEQVAAQDARSEPRFCGYSVPGDRGGPPEACGKELPCSVAGHFDAASELRRLWWLDHGCEVAALYGDDGEMQCNRCRIDFKRGSLVDLAQHVYTKKTERLASLASPERAKAHALLNELIDALPNVPESAHVFGQLGDGAFNYAFERCKEIRDAALTAAREEASRG